MMSRKQLDDALALANAATPGPWRGDRLDGTVKYEVLGADDVQVLRVDHKNGEFGFLSDNSMSDERFVLASRTLVPALVAEVLRWRRQWAVEHTATCGNCTLEVDDCIDEDTVDCAEARSILAEDPGQKQQQSEE